MPMNTICAYFLHMITICIKINLTSCGRLEKINEINNPWIGMEIAQDMMSLKPGVIA
jgi:hypothetical protein